METTVISLLNSKGGVAKTVTAVNLACALQRAEKKVLLIDADAQYNASLHFGYSAKYIKDNGLTTFADDLSDIFDAMMENKPYHNDYSTIIHTNEGPDLVAGSVGITPVEEELIRATTKETGDLILKDYITSFRGLYDFVLIDLHPSLGSLQRSAIKMSDMIIVPLAAEYFAAEGMTQILDCIYEENPTTKPYGLFTKVVRSELRENWNTETKTWIDEVVNNYSNSLNRFDTMIPKDASINKATGWGVSVLTFDPESDGAKHYYKLAKEIIGYEFSHTPKLDIPIDEIDEDTAWMKKASAEFKEDIRKNGIKKRLEVREKKNGRYEVVHGYRRIAAARDLNMETVPCEVIKITVDKIPQHRNEANQKEEN